MDYQSLIGLEYFKLLKHLSGFAHTSAGKDACLQVRPHKDLHILRQQISQVSEARVLLEGGESPSLEELTEVDPILKRAALEGALLDGIELLEILNLVRIGARIKSLLLTEKNEAPHLCRVAEPIAPLEELASQIESVLDSQGFIKDTASSELKRLRKGVNRQKRIVLEGLNGILQQPRLRHIWQDTVVSFRNDRYVLPVKSGSRNSLPGIIHDFSQTKATCFIEPWDMVELNNELSMLVSQEKAEVERILRALSNQVRLSLHALKRNLHILVALDVIFAKARMSRFLNAREPVLSEDEIDLQDAVHPLLAFRKLERTVVQPVPLNIRFPAHISTIVVSGANMGGKTVALKTLGLLSLMFQSGMHIPVREDSRLRVFSSIHAVIGDEQDLSRDLSTFSSQIGRIVEILEVADSSSLVLLDEICTNTDPGEGGALALAVMDHLARIGAKVMVTTHYTALKMYGITQENVLNVSVDFDAASDTPTYGLNYGSPGLSNALEISKKLGLPHQIFERAQEYLSPDQRKALGLIHDIEASYKKMRQHEQEVTELKEALTSNKERYERLSSELEEQREAILEKERKRARTKVRRAEQRFHQALRSLRSSGPEQFQEERDQKRVFREIEKTLMQELTPTRKGKGRINQSRLQAGCTVRLKDSNQRGTVLSMDQGGRKVEVLVGGVRVQTVKERLEYLEAADTRSPQSGHRINAVFDSGLREVNLTGLSVEDALIKVDKVIDQAVLSGKERVDLVHGVGTGALRRAIRERLKEHSMVKSFDHPDARQGGVGVTVVELEG